MRANEFVTEHRLVWQRNPKTGTVKMKWRCETGTRKGRTVPNVSDCNKQIDIGKSVRMRTTRQRTGRVQARKSALTKGRSYSSRLSKKLNKVYRPIQPKQTSTAKIYKWKRPRLNRARAKSTYYK